MYSHLDALVSQLSLPIRQSYVYHLFDQIHPCGHEPLVHSCDYSDQKMAYHQLDQSPNHSHLLFSSGLRRGTLDTRESLLRS